MTEPECWCASPQVSTSYETNELYCSKCGRPLPDDYSPEEEEPPDDYDN